MEQQKANTKTSRRWLTAESALLERIGLPEEVELFEEFEELAKTYTIEAPYVSRSQIELMFDVYDGRKLSQGGPSEGVNPVLGVEQASGKQNKQQPDYKLSGSDATAGQPVSSARRSVGGLKAIARRSKTPNLSWCKLLWFAHAQNRTNKQSNPSRRKRTLQCCLSKSETGTDLWLSPASSATSFTNSTKPRLSSNNNNNTDDDNDDDFDYLNAALDSDDNSDGNGKRIDRNRADKEEEAELKAEVLQLIGPLLHRLRRSSTLSLDGNSNPMNLVEQQQQVILDGSVGAAGRLSVCLFDMKNRIIKVKADAENGRRWWRIESILEDLRWKFRCNNRRGAMGKDSDNDTSWLSRYFEQRHLSRSSVMAQERWTRSERLSRPDFDRLIGLTKDSLNHLIDAQLLLRNKLANELQQPNANQQQQSLHCPSSALHLQPAQQQQCLIARENEYESLLRNNFNLLKVWQNYEETKRLACFVCEPIKANLADLFWFSRQRFALASSNHHHPSGSCLLSSPLVSLDAIQIKRGLIQILEALHYLHAICKLVHRNVNPSNILIAANDNWKLSGLQFAIRFESATISESASIMASEGSNMLRYSASSSGQSNRLRRQRTLHQTKCEEFSRKPKCGNGILQPEVDYLAPEIWKSSKCSHKSDLFSYGLILGQTYDLFRHKPPISCRSNLDAYERELKKLVERRKLKLSRLVPLEMREALLATLECEPNVRPSANYALQLFRRPIELCKANDDSLRHLRRSLRFLDTACPAAFGLSSSVGWQHQHQPQHQPQPQPLAASQQQQAISSPAGGFNSKGRGSYFRKVTSASANQAPRSRQQSKTLHLLNLLLRGVDSLAQMGQNSCGFDEGSNANLAATPSPQFANLRSQFEYTFESLRQLFGASHHTTAWHLCGGVGQVTEGADSPAELGSLFAASKPADQRSLMLVIALHRRLLDQLGRMRMELPPVCRLAASNSPLNRPTPRHRALAEMEDKLHCLVSCYSLTKLAPILTDPLLKLDEFLLLYELIGDLFAFVGQKCRQNFLQRGKQLLNELTPVTGCPSSSSSDDDDDDDDDEHERGENFNNNNNSNINFVTPEQFDQQQQFDTCAQSRNNNNNIVQLGASREKLNGHLPNSLYHQQADINNQLAPTKMAHSSSNNSSSRRFSEYPDQLVGDHQSAMLSSSAAASRHHRASAGDYLLQQPQLHTRISITAPSPMGSMRDINNNSQNSNSSQQFGANKPSRFTSQQQHNDLCDRTSGLSLRDGDLANLQLNEGEQVDKRQDEEAQERSRSASDQGVDKVGDKSRSQLIDELLRSINDDSFTADYVDLNGKFHRGTGTGTGSAGQHRAAAATCSVVPAAVANHQSASQLANMNRPKSALDGTQTCSASQSASASYQQRRQSNRPNSLALNQQQQQRPNVAPTSTFDNVIRRMSTNLVQNFNKMSSNTLGSAAVADQQQDFTATLTGPTTFTAPTTIAAATEATTTASMSNVRREKSSNYANSLYVDNQVPARRHSDNTINVPRIQVALSSPQAGNSRFGLNQRASVSASKLANKWKLSAKTNQREASDKLSPNLGGALGYMRRHSSGNTTGNDKSQSNGQTSSSNLLLNSSPFKTKSSSNLGFDFLISNRSMKRRCSAASMLGHQTQRKAENLIDAGMKSVQNMFG